GEPWPPGFNPGNVISGNYYEGIALLGADTPIPVTGNLIAGNKIGTDASGTTAYPNGTGIFIENADNNTIGGAPHPGTQSSISGTPTQFPVGTDTTGSIGTGDDGQTSDHTLSTMDSVLQYFDPLDFPIERKLQANLLASVTAGAVLNGG